jgi:NTE family protein
MPAAALAAMRQPTIAVRAVRAVKGASPRLLAATPAEFPACPIPRPTATAVTTAHRSARRRWLVALPLACGVLPACGLLPGRSTTAAGLSPAAGGNVAGTAAAPAPRKPRLGLALGGGAARGFAHVGVIEVLEQAGLRPDLVVGTSAGSVVGALYASGMSPRALREAALGLEEGALGDWTLSSRGVLRGRALQDSINRWVGARPIERFALPYAAVMTDLYDGSMRLARSGDAGLAVRASSAVPGVFEPVRIGDREYVDGGLVSPVPVRAARALGAEVVIAVDISAKPRFQDTDSLPRVLLQSVAIMSQHLAAAELREADSVVTPLVGDRGSADFSDRAGAMALGAQAMRDALPALQSRIARWRA